mgnify:CR=1 FL=1
MNGLRDIVAMVNGKVNDFVWGLPMLVLLVGTGILMTVLTKGLQLSHFRFWMAHTVGAIFKNKHVTAHTAKEDRSISQFQSLCTALAATIGTGNIAGVAAAIAAGGPGAASSWAKSWRCCSVYSAFSPASALAIWDRSIPLPPTCGRFSPFPTGSRACF